MTRRITVDFISDVSCPWCVIGLLGFQEALRRVDGLIEAEIRFQPFELNPDMPPGGENIREHIARKYGADRARSSATRDAIRAGAEALGFTMATGEESRIYNTFDAHRLLHWAAGQGAGRQAALKRALFEAYFSRGRRPRRPDGPRRRSRPRPGRRRRSPGLRPLRRRRPRGASPLARGRDRLRPHPDHRRPVRHHRRPPAGRLRAGAAEDGGGGGKGGLRLSGFLNLLLSAPSFLPEPGFPAR